MARRILCLLSLFFTLNPLSFPLHAGGLRSLRRVNGSVVETNVYQPGKSDGQPRRVVIIDIDGLPSGGTLFYFRTLPNFRRIIGQYTETGFERAVYFRKATTIFPSVTLPGHASIFTGTYPGVHGIVGNEWFDRRSGRLINYMSLRGQLGIYIDGMANQHLEVPTLYTAARQARKRSLVGFSQYWRGADYVEKPDKEVIDYVFAERLLSNPDNSGERFKKYDQGMVEEIIRRLDGLRRNGKPLPDIITLYFAGADTIGHLIGVSATLQYLEDVIDPLIGKFLDKLQELDPNWLQHTLFFITSDHGRSDIPWENSEVGGKLKDMVEHALAEAGYDPGLEKPLGRRDVHIALNGGMAHIYIKNRQNAQPRRGVPPTANTTPAVNPNPWEAPPRFEEDILPAANALVRDEALKRYVAAVFVRGKSDYSLYWSQEKSSQLNEEQMKLIQRLNSDRSGDILLLLRNEFYFRRSCRVQVPFPAPVFCSVEDLAASAGTGSNHGSIWPSDLGVPLIVAGGNVVPGISDEPVSIVNIAQTVAWYLGFNMSWAEPRLPIEIKSYDDLPPAASDLPTLLLIDTSGSMADNNKIEQARQAALDALSEIKRNMRQGVSPPPVAVLTFSGPCSPASTRKLVDFTSNLDQVEHTLRFNLPRPGGGTPSPQAVEVALNEMKAFLNKHPNVAEGRIILLSDGQSTCGNVRPPGIYSRRWDIPVGPGANRSAGGQGQSRITFLTIGFDVAPGSEAERDLQYLASISGGKYFNAPDRRQLARTFQKFVRVFVPRSLGMASVVSSDALADFERGQQAMLQRDYPAALKAFRSFIAAEPNHPVGLYNLAQALEATDHYKGAAEYYSRYLEVAPTAPDRAEVEQRIQQMRQDYIDQFAYYLEILRSDLAYLKRYYHSLFHRRNEELAREFGGFVAEKAEFYGALPDILEVELKWLERGARDLSDSLYTLAERIGLPTFDRDAVSLLTIPIGQLEELIRRLEHYQAQYVR